MKQILIYIAIFLAVVTAFCVGFFGENYLNQKEIEFLFDERYEEQILLAINDLENQQKNRIESDKLEEYIYCASNFAKNDELSTALHGLWNVLHTSRNGLYSNLDNTIVALKNADASAISKATLDIENIALELSNIEWGENQIYAVVFLGYSQGDAIKYDEYLEKYFDVENTHTQTFYDVSGDENYLFIPRYPEIPTIIYDYYFGEDDFETGVQLYEIVDTKHFVLKCNVSDIWSNVLITTQNGDEIFEYSPRISLEDGTFSEDEFVYSPK
ncbi:MAG: hypothetical protein R3Y12_05035 [Clostridia bacterium]